MNWTPEQETAIAYRGGAAVVSAAAGSGKTAVLVERIVRLLTDAESPVPADRLVVVTFTEKAAGELKARLNAALSAATERDPESELLRRQLIRLEDASISTISAFCLSLLRRYSAFLELSPDFTVADDAGQTLSLALDAVLEDFYATADEEEKALLYDWYGGENDEALAETVQGLYEFSRNLPDAAAFFADQLSIYENPAEKLPPLKKEFYAREIAPLLTEGEALYSPFLLSEEARDRLFAEGWRSFFERYRALGTDFADREAVELFLSEKLPDLPRKTKDYDNTAAKEAHDELKEIREKLLPLAGLFHRAEEDCLTCAPVFRLLVGLVEALEEEFTRRKRRDNQVDFADIELAALRLLRDEKTAREIADGIAVIIVDEFQDSNEIQYEIFRRLSADGKNLYFVGDVKQSIYRFRGADPRVFIRLLEDESFRTILLNRNFRSSEKVIEPVNAIFEGTMTRERGGIDYGEDAKLIQGMFYETDERYGAELIRIHGESAEKAREAEAAYLADRIGEMIESGFPVTERGARRPCRPGDFAILMGRYASNAHIYKRALARAGIAFEAKEETRYIDFAEIRFTLALLTVVDNPYRDRELAAVLTLPPYSFTADELASAKLGGGEKRHKSLYAGLRSYAETSEKAARFLAELDELRAYAAEHPIERLVRKIYDESGFVEATRALPDGERRDANLKRLIGDARRFSAKGSRGLYDFLRYMERSAKFSPAQKTVSGAGSENAVKLMTIHGSKGLEFPICFVANLSSAERHGGASLFAAETTRGIGLKLVDREKMLKLETFLYRYVEDENRRQEESEAMRLLYVAATRAREKLVFTAPIGAKRENSEPRLHLKWVGESGAVKRGLIETKELYGYTAKPFPKKEGEAGEAPRLAPFTPYPYRRYAEIPAKATATQVGVKSVNDFAPTVDKIDRFLRVPSFLRGGERLSGKKKGDAYHKALEMIDFAGGVDQLDALAERGKLTEAERGAIKDEEIKIFLGSSLCRRIRASGEVYREYPIFFEYSPEPIPEGEEKPFIQGIADLYFVEDGEIVLVDYKTNVGVSAETLREEYEGQLYIYRDALEQATGLKVKECLLYAFSLGETIEIG
ncbi:MAG: UvrD-helicase domain-containing protein [Bacteroides sp.]|nr:UvrD-helicase domain-containing protein [Eubacterium sp.]MCM1417514.1 UvrD-helicase domain-containing protein [Roseburia sp.]MCM1462549.1 UvrD-helicase domain-containing protein [Bacteroides sp.]